MYCYSAIRTADGLTGECRTIGVFFVDSESGTPPVHFHYFHRDPDPILQAMVDDIIQSVKTPEDLRSNSFRSGVQFVGLWLTSLKPHDLPPHEFFKMNLSVEFNFWDYAD